MRRLFAVLVLMVVGGAAEAGDGPLGPEAFGLPPKLGRADFGGGVSCGCEPPCGCTPCRCLGTKWTWTADGLVETTAAPYPTAVKGGLAFTRDYSAGMKAARGLKKPVVILVGSKACAFCRKLEAGPLNDKAVKEALAGFVLIYVDGEDNAELRKVLEVTQYPALFTARPDGRGVKSHQVSPPTVESLLDHLKNYDRPAAQSSVVPVQPLFFQPPAFCRTG
jgi:thiol-disulfide isomerase/thioredoxin